MRALLEILKPAPKQGEEEEQEEDEDEGDLRHPPRPESRLSAPGTRKALNLKLKNKNEKIKDKPWIKDKPFCVSESCNVTAPRVAPLCARYLHLNP